MEPGVETLQQSVKRDAESFLAFGLPTYAFVKPVTNDDGQRAFGIFRADGTMVAVAGSRELANVVIRQNDMEPMSVH